MPESFAQPSFLHTVIALAVVAATFAFLGYVIVVNIAKPAARSVFEGVVTSAELLRPDADAPCCEHDAEGRMITRVEQTMVSLDDGSVVVLTGDVRAICAVGSRVRISLNRFHHTIARPEHPPEPQPAAES